MKSSDRAISLWAIQDNLLQSYRGIFLTSLSIFTALALSLTQAHDQGVLSYFVSLFGMYVNVIWINLAWERGQSVYFLQTLIRRFEAAEQCGDAEPAADVFTTLRKFQDNHAYALKEHSSPDFIAPDPARFSLNFGLPCLYLCFWFAQTLYAGWRALSQTILGLAIPTIVWSAFALAALWFIFSFVVSAIVVKRLFIKLRFWRTLVLTFCLTFGVYFATQYVHVTNACARSIANRITDGISAAFLQ